MRTIRTRPHLASRLGGLTWRPAGHSRSPAAATGQEAPAVSDASHPVAELYRLHYPSLVRLAALLVPDLVTAEEIVQDAFAATYVQCPMRPGPDAALAYLRRSVIRRSRSAAPSRSSGARLVVPPQPAGGTGSAVMAALRALPARQREVVVLRYFAELPEAEIASATGMRAAAVRSHAAQAMSSLYAGLGQAGA